MSPPLIHLSNIALTFGGRNLLDGAELLVAAGERLCLVGRNGSGKSTLMKIAAGLIEPDRGNVFVKPGTTMRYLQQEPDFSRYASTLDCVIAGLGPGDDAYVARYLLEELGLTGDEDPARLSGGEARRVALAQALAPNPDVLLLDEPTNHLDLPAIEWLERELKSRQSAMVLISHDRRFLSNLTRSTLWLDRGRTRSLERGFGAFETWRDEMLAEEELNQHKLGRKIADEEHWLRYGVTARRKRNVRRLEGLLQLRTDKREHRRAEGKAVLDVAEAEASTALVIEAKRIGKKFEDREVIRDFSIRVMRKDRIGIVGANGSGKTTLVKLLTGILPPDGGSIRLGANLEMVTLEQNRDSLAPDCTVADALTGGGSDTVMVGGKPRHVVGYMKDFLFSPEQARTPLRVLSGGERARLMLAHALSRSSNLLVLDEPTNDLDLETLDVLEEMLSDYQGTVILISHDRDFIDRLVTTTLAPDGTGRWVVYAGGFTDMITQGGSIQPVARGVPLLTQSSPTKAVTPPAAAPRSAKRKLSFNEKHRLETLPATMEKLRAVIVKIQDKLAIPDLYTRDQKTFTDASALLAKAQSELTAQEEAWLELEILREEIENG